SVLAGRASTVKPRACGGRCARRSGGYLHEYRPRINYGAQRVTTMPIGFKRARNLWRTTTCSLARRMRIGLRALRQSSRGLATWPPPVTRWGTVWGRLGRGQSSTQTLDRRHQDCPEGLLEENSI